MKFFFRAFFGNLASALWFISPASKLLHQWRGIRFEDRKSVFISKGVILDNRYPELIYIGKDVWLTQNVSVLSHSYVSAIQQRDFGIQEKVAPVTIENGVFIGLGSIVLPGVVLGEGCYIGAGSVVTTNVPRGMLAAGNPCRVLRPLDHKGTK